jgi:hypothetical protein
MYPRERRETEGEKMEKTEHDYEKRKRPNVNCLIMHSCCLESGHNIERKSYSSQYHHHHHHHHHLMETFNFLYLLFFSDKSLKIS